MKPIEDNHECKVHVLVCTNERPEGKSCCKKVGGQDFFQKLKEKIKAAGLYNTHWVTRTGCLGFCNDVGTTVAIYPKDRPSEWMNEVTMEEFDQIWEKITRY